jgi:Ca-activated chloride channel family protein
VSAALLALAPLLWAALLVLDRARARRLDRLLGGRAPARGGARRARRRGAGRALAATGLLLALAAALDAAPAAVGGGAGGPDVVLCLDVSRSMLATDLAPDRLGRARGEIRALAEHAKGDRIGLVVFAGEARPLVPLTRDLRSLAEMALAADPLSVKKGGTDLGAALDAALALLGDRRPAAIVLVTDGEDLGGSGLEAARRCALRGVAVHCLGLGTALGGKIAEGGAFLKDRSGAEVVSALDPAGLRRIAEAAGGAFVENGSLSRLWDAEIAAPERPAGDAGDGGDYRWPLSLAVLLWLVDLSLGERRRR